jgi:hypothetical protein
MATRDLVLQRTRPIAPRSRAVVPAWLGAVSMTLGDFLQHGGVMVGPARGVRRSPAAECGWQARGRGAPQRVDQSEGIAICRSAARRTKQGTKQPGLRIRWVYACCIDGWVGGWMDGEALCTCTAHDSESEERDASASHCNPTNRPTTPWRRHSSSFNTKHPS